MPLSVVTIGSTVADDKLEADVAQAVRTAGAECVRGVGHACACDGFVHDSVAVALRTMRPEIGRVDPTVPRPTLLIVADSGPVGGLLRRCAPSGLLSWVPRGPGGELYALEEAVEYLVRRACTAHVCGLLTAARPDLPAAVSSVVWRFLDLAAQERVVPALSRVLRDGGVAPRTAERVWRCLGLQNPNRFMDRVLLLFLGVEATRLQRPASRIAQELGIGARALSHLRARAPVLRSIRDLYGEDGLRALIECVVERPSQVRAETDRAWRCVSGRAREDAHRD